MIGEGGGSLHGNRTGLPGYGCEQKLWCVDSRLGCFLLHGGGDVGNCSSFGLCKCQHVDHCLSVLGSLVLQLQNLRKFRGKNNVSSSKDD